MENEETITVSKEEYKQLQSDSLKLQCLDEGGVDNWEWYGEAMREYRKRSKELGSSDEDDE
jgi:hypothetical protein